MSTAALSRGSAISSPNVFTFIPARPSVATAMSQIGSEMILSRVSGSSLGQSISAGLYGSCVSSMVWQKSARCSGLPRRIGPDGTGSGLAKWRKPLAIFMARLLNEVLETPPGDPLARDRLARKRVGERGQLGAIGIAGRMAGIEIVRRWVGVDLGQAVRQVSDQTL